MALPHYSSVAREDAVKVQRLVRMSKGGETGDSSKPGKQAQESLAAVSAPPDSSSLQADVYISLSSLQSQQQFADMWWVNRSHFYVELMKGQSICRFFGEKIDPSDPAVAKAYCDDFCDVRLTYFSLNLHTQRYQDLQIP